jgi:peptidylprolyl isomerase
VNNNRNYAIAAGAALFLAIAIGVIIKGTSTPATPAPTDLPTTPVSTSPTESASTASTAPAGRKPPAKPDAATGYTTTASGLQYADLVPGTGESPEHGSIVTVEYTGWLKGADGNPGRMFDSSYKGSTPFQFAIGKGNVIPGWDEGVMSMKIGGKRQLVIPADLGYGQRGAPPDIPGGATLIFDVELLAVAPPRVTPAAPQKFADADYTTTASGLKVHDITVGTGEQPEMGQRVTVEYTGWLTNGKMFDSSYEGPGPVTFQLGKVIKGWNEGVGGMKVGGKRQLIIPPDLAYGPKTIPPGADLEHCLIPPDSTLVFEVELVDVK